MQVSDRHISVAVAALCLLWYSIGSTSNVLNKSILQVFPFPLTLAMSNICATALYSIPLAWTSRTNLLNVRRTFGRGWKLLLPLAFGKLIAVSSSFISLSKVPVSYAHTGVTVASLSEQSFSAAGLLSALSSTCAYALMSAFVKKILQETGLHHTVLLALIAQISCLLLLPLWLINDVQSFADKGDDQPMTLRIFAMLCASGLLNFAQNVCTFSLIHKLSALSYAVVNAAKRIIVITVSLVTLRNPVTPVNVFGMCLAIFGVFAYNRAKQLSCSVCPLVVPSSDSLLQEKLYFPFTPPVLPLSFNAADIQKHPLASTLRPNNGDAIANLYLHTSPSSIDLV